MRRLVFLILYETHTRQLIVIRYFPQSWLSKPRFAVSGIIYRSTPNEADGEKEFFELETSGDKRFSKVKQVSKDDIVATFEGNWRGEIKWKKAGESVSSDSSGTH